MCASLTDEDVGKLVERADGRVIGTVDSLEGGTVRVEPEPDALDTIKARFGWGDLGEPFTLEESDVRECSETRVHLEEGFGPSDRERTDETADGASNGEVRATDQSTPGPEEPRNRSDP